MAITLSEIFTYMVDSLKAVTWPNAFQGTPVKLGTKIILSIYGFGYNTEQPTVSAPVQNSSSNHCLDHIGRLRSGSEQRIFTNGRTRDNFDRFPRYLLERSQAGQMLS